MDPSTWLWCTDFMGLTWEGCMLRAAVLYILYSDRPLP